MHTLSWRLWFWLIVAIIVGVAFGQLLGYTIEQLLRCANPDSHCYGYWWQWWLGLRER